MWLVSPMGRGLVQRDKEVSYGHIQLVLGRARHDQRSRRRTDHLHVGADRIRISDADSFFNEVLRKVERLLGIDAHDPLPVQQGVAVLQSYLQQRLGVGGSDFSDDLSPVVSQLFAHISLA